MNNSSILKDTKDLFKNRFLPIEFAYEECYFYVKPYDDNIYFLKNECDEIVKDIYIKNEDIKIELYLDDIWQYDLPEEALDSDDYFETIKGHQKVNFCDITIIFRDNLGDIVYLYKTYLKKGYFINNCSELYNFFKKYHKE